jgi:hypothetical protein
LKTNHLATLPLTQMSRGIKLMFAFAILTPVVIRLNPVLSGFEVVGFFWRAFLARDENFEKKKK